MKKLISITILLIMLLGLFSACNNNNEVTADSDAVDIAAPDYSVEPVVTPDDSQTIPTDEPSATDEPVQTANTATVTPAPTPVPTPVPTPTPDPIESIGYWAAHINRNGVNLRSEPNTSSEVIKKLNLGEKVFLTGKLEGWYRVMYNETTGFVSEDFITLGSFATPTPKPTPKPTVKPTPKPTPKPTTTPKPTNTPKPESYHTVYPGQFTESEIYLVATYLKREQPYGGQKDLRAIASVILNRALDTKTDIFPDTIRGVLFQHNQFCTEEQLEGYVPDEKCLQAARYVLSEHGATMPKTVFFFRAAYLGIVWHPYEDFTQYYTTINGINFYKGIKYW